MDYPKILQTKKEVVHFCLALRDQLGLTQDLSFLTSLIKLHDVMLAKMIATIDKKVLEIMEQEDYKVIQVTNGEEYFKWVDKYEIDIKEKEEESSEGEVPTLKA